MIGDLKSLPELAKWFLQSNLEAQDVSTTVSVDGFSFDDVTQEKSTRPLCFPTQKANAKEVIEEIKKLKDEIEKKVKFIIIHGKIGVGKSTVLREIVCKLIREEIFNKEKILFFSLKEHSSMDSLYSLCSRLARNLDLRKDSAALEELEGNTERKDEAVVRVLQKFDLICIDDIDADDCLIFSHIKGNLKDLSQQLLVLGSCTDNEKFCKKLHNSKLFPLKPFSNKETSDFLRELLNFDESVLIPEWYMNITKGIAADICILASVIKHHSDVKCLMKHKAQLCSQKLESPILTAVNLELDCLSKHLLEQLCKIRRPIPVQDTQLFHKLANFGLVLLLTNNGHQFLSVPSSIQKRHQQLVKCSDHCSESNRICTAVELWKMCLSPKLADILQGCQKENWTFVPESWNSIKDVGSADRYNVNDLINKTNMYYSNLKEYDIILECLYHTLLEKDFNQSVALIFLIDRYTFWTGTCKAALSVLKYIEEESPETPVPPQIVIRKARVLKNDGNIQDAVKILDLVINNEKKIGSYCYNSLDDSKHVTALCVSIKGDILRGLSLWKEAAITLVRSVDLTNALQRIEKKIISGSKAHLADTFRYMSIKDYEEVASQLSLTTGHPLREAIHCATEAAQLCTFTPLFYLKNKRRAGDLSLIISRQLPDDQKRFEYLENAAHEFREGLRCHDSISRLESKDQFYEFVLAIQRLSLICKEKVVAGKIGGNIGVTLEKLAKLLYEHHCLFPQQIKHNEYSKTLINLALSLMNLPKIPEDDNLEMVNAHVPLVEVTPSQAVQALSQVRGELVGEIDEIVSVSRKPIDNNDDVVDKLPKEEKPIESRDEKTNVVSSNEDTKNGKFDLRNATTLLDSKTAERFAITVKPLNSKEGNKNLDGALGAISRAAITEETRGHQGKAALNIRDRTTVHSIDEEGHHYIKHRHDDSTNIRDQTTVQSIEEDVHHYIKHRHDNSTNIRDQTTVQSIEGDVHHYIKHQHDNFTNIRDKTTAIEEAEYTCGIKSNPQPIQDSIRTLKTASTTVELCYATAEDESIIERHAKVEDTLNTLETNDKLAVNWATVEKLHSGIGLPTDVHRAVQWLFDPKTQYWATSETLVYIGEKLQLGKKEGACRDAFNIEFLEQDDPLRKYIGKQYKLEKYRNKPKLKRQYQQDIICQSLSRYYATLFNTALYQCPDGKSIGQVQFLPAVLIEILDIENEPERYYNVEPFIAGDFVKISNNFAWTVQGDVPGKDLLMAFSHFSFWSSQGKLIVVDIQGWTSNEKEGQTYLTDPQIHTMDRQGFGTANRGEEGFLKFWTEQHPICSSICKMLGLDKYRPSAENPTYDPVSKS